jgi:flagellar motility protein MotE (MotC chaperone)
MNKLANPIVVILLGLIFGVGTTMGVLMQASSKLLEGAAEAAKARRPVQTTEPEKHWDFWTTEIENLANDLKEERALLKQRSEQLDQREARMQLEVQELEKTRRQIESMRTAIDQRLAEVTAGEATNLKKLAQTYSVLTPKAAVTIFREMDDTMVVKLLALMKPDVVGAIFEEISKQSASDPALAKRAAQLSERLRLIKVYKPTDA